MNQILFSLLVKNIKSHKLARIECRILNSNWISSHKLEKLNWKDESCFDIRGRQIKTKVLRQFQAFTSQVQCFYSIQPNSFTHTHTNKYKEQWPIIKISREADDLTKTQISTIFSDDGMKQSKSSRKGKSKTSCNRVTQASEIKWHAVIVNFKIQPRKNFREKILRKICCYSLTGKKL